MFRRKEDSLFDNTTDSNQPQTTAHDAAAVPPASGTGNPATSGGAYAAVGTRAQVEARPSTAVPASSSFRPAAAPISSDMTRNRMPEAKSSAAIAMQNATSSTGKGRRILTVGNDILLKGEIATCDRLVIEGKVDATLNDVHTVEIAEAGSFKGAAHIEEAEISGLFEGELVVRGRLVIYATGKVRGKISYGEIEIERGGELSGEIKLTSAQGGVASRPRHKDDNNKAAAA